MTDNDKHEPNQPETPEDEGGFPEGKTGSTFGPVPPLKGSDIAYPTAEDSEQMKRVAEKFSFPESEPPGPRGPSTEELEKITLRRETFGLETRLGTSLRESFANPADIQVFLDDLSDQLVIQIRQEVFGQGLQRYEVNFAKTWWDAFKERWFPPWLKNLVKVKRCPNWLKRWVSVNMVQVVLDAKALYPTVAPLPGHRGYVNIVQETTEMNKYK